MAKVPPWHNQDKREANYESSRFSVQSTVGLLRTKTLDGAGHGLVLGGEVFAIRWPRAPLPSRHFLGW